MKFKNGLGIIALTLIVAYGFYLRVYNIGSQSLWIDEIYTLNAARQVVSHGYALLDSGNWYVNNFFSVYVSAVIVFFRGLDPFDPWLYRLPAAVLGSLVVVGTYIISIRLNHNRIFATFSALIISLTYSEIAWSRQVRGYMALSLFIIIATYYLWKIVNDSHVRRDVIFFSTSVVLAALSHWVALAFLPAFFVIWYSRSDARRIYKEQLSIIYLVVICGLSSAVIFVSQYIVGINKGSALITRYLKFPFFPFYVLLAFSVVYYVLSIPSLRIKESLRVSGTLIICLMTFCSALVVKPLESYVLRDSSPQPNFAKVFRYINDHTEEGSVVISPDPVIAKIYTGNYGLWFPNMFKRLTSVDYYSGLKPIRSLDDLRSILGHYHGFIILDNIATYSEKTNKLQFIKDPAVTSLVLHDIDALSQEQIWLYEF